MRAHLLADFFHTLLPLAATEPDLPSIGGLLTELAADAAPFEEDIEKLPTDRFGGRLVHATEEGPRLLIVHRPEGVMGAVHSHSVWVALAPLQGTETHRQWDVVDRTDDGTARVALGEERRLERGDAVTLVPPLDVHSHGHVTGTGDPAYLLILSGDDQFRYERAEYDVGAGTWRPLAPGETGTL